MSNDIDPNPVNETSDNTIDWREVWLGDNTPVAGDTGNSSPAEMGLRTNSGDLDFIHGVLHKMDEMFTRHSQENEWIRQAFIGAGGNDHIVDVAGRGSESWDGGQIAIPSTSGVDSQRLVGKRTKRRTVTFVNNSGVIVYLGRSSGVNTSDMRLMPGATLSISTRNEVWGATPLGAVAVTLDYFETFDND